MKFFGRGGLLHPTLNVENHLAPILKYSCWNVIVNVGCGEHRLSPHIINVDLYAGSEVDITGDGHSLPLQDSSVDVVLLLAVLEHVKEPQKVIDEAYRVLRDGGEVYCEFPFLQPVHSSADYWRATLEGLRYLFRGFKEIDAGICTRGTVSWILIEYLRGMFKQRWLQKAMFLLASIVVPLLKYLDLEGIKIGAGFYYYGIKE